MAGGLSSSPCHSLQGYLSVFTAWWLGFPRMGDPRKKKTDATVSSMTKAMGYTSSFSQYFIGYTSQPYSGWGTTQGCECWVPRIIEGHWRATLEAGYHTPMTHRAELQIGIFPTEHGLLNCSAFYPYLLLRLLNGSGFPPLPCPL